MSANDSRNNKTIHTSLNDFLDFGPDNNIKMPTPSVSSSNNDVVLRIQQLVKKLQELNTRVERLSHLF